jgi:hypothetical protein
MAASGRPAGSTSHGGLWWVTPRRNLTPHRAAPLSKPMSLLADYYRVTDTPGQWGGRGSPSALCVPVCGLRLCGVECAGTTGRLGESSQVAALWRVQRGGASRRRRGCLLRAVLQARAYAAGAARGPSIMLTAGARGLRGRRACQQSACAECWCGALVRTAAAANVGEGSRSLGLASCRAVECGALRGRGAPLLLMRKAFDREGKRLTGKKTHRGLADRPVRNVAGWPGQKECSSCQVGGAKHMRGGG